MPSGCCLLGPSAGGGTGQTRPDQARTGQAGEAAAEYHSASVAVCAGVGTPCCLVLYWGKVETTGSLAL